MRLHLLTVAWPDGTGSPLAEPEPEPAPARPGLDGLSGIMARLHRLSTFHRPQGACVMIGAAHEPPRPGQANGEVPSCQLLCGVLEFAGLGHVDPGGPGSTRGKSNGYTPDLL